MALGFYYLMFMIALVMVVVYAFIFHKHFDVNLTIIAVLVPILNFGFLVMAKAQVVEEALIGLRITYLGGCYLIVAVMFLIFNICDIPVKPWFRVALLTFSTVVYASTLTIGYNNIFYVGLPDIDIYEGATYITNRHYGPMHTVFYAMVIIYYLLTVAAIIYCIVKKKQVPITIIILIIVSVSIAVFGFFGGKIFSNKLEILPATYNLGMIIYIIIASRLRLYDASDSVIDALVQKGDTGFISFDVKMRYLDSNITAKEMIPELHELKVDRLSTNEWINNNFPKWVEEYEKDNHNDHFHFEKNNKTYLVRVSRLKLGRFFSHGYQFLVSDDTANQQYIKLIQNYNTQLEEEVVRKTRHIIDMQDKLVLGMATMVEGRDNSTGGHIKRTSDCIRIIVNEIQKEGDLKLSDSFCQKLIKAAPMHDLGKITVDDHILRKPGKFTPEEYEEMKKHAPEGARIVSRILEGFDDQEFRDIAVNVAHYHHEKYNGMGYPDKLAGEEIPLEARIMALAYVYDALISKRVYKEKFSFEQANEIILSEMGKQFDPRLEKVYLNCRDQLEDYYRNTDC
ncbi:MAG: HD domain-containing protein [Bacilli bacterium]|nr:HD domain-containing protein [Bacilli bacterium]